MSHLLPSSASFGGFLPARDAGLVGRAGRLAALAADETGEADARSSGFLCVISLLSTFLRPLVTSGPSSANRPPAAGAGALSDAADDAGVKFKGSWPCTEREPMCASAIVSGRLFCARRKHGCRVREAADGPWGSRRRRSCGT